MGMAAPIFYTAEMVRALPDDGNRYEAVRGELLVTPAPRIWHEIIVGRLHLAIQEYLRIEPVGHGFASRSDISWGPDTLVEPDIFVAPFEEVRTLDIPLHWIVDPDERQVEIWSPADTFPRLERERLVWHPAGAAGPFVLSLEDLFRPL